MDIKIQAGQPFTLPDGSVVLPTAEPDGTKVIKMDDDDDAQSSDTMDDMGEDFEVAPVLDRTLADINSDFKTFATTLVVAACALWGLNAFSSAKVLNTTEDHINNIRDSDLYDQIFKEIRDGVRYSEASSVHGYLLANAKTAARQIVKHVKSKDGDRSLSASRDVLDRTGFRPVDRVEHHHSFDDELVIRYVEDTKMKTIDLDVGE